MTDAALELIPLCTARLRIAETISLMGSPSGSRMIGEIRDARFESDRFRASQKGMAAADWFVLHPNGIGTMDVRLALETDDGVAVYVSYYGRTDMATGLGYSAPVFETGGEQYEWLNRILTVARGRFDPETMVVTYDIYELR